MSVRLEDCDAMLAAAAKARGKFMIAQVIRFWPEFVYLREVYQDRRFGELRALHIRRQAARPDYTLANWILNPELSGGAVIDLHVHDVDFVLGLLGKPRSITASGYADSRGSVDRVHACWEYGGNLSIHLEGFWDMPDAYPFNMGYTAVFEKAALHYDLTTGKPLALMHPGRKEVETPELLKDDGYFREIDYFLGCIARNETPRVSTPQESRDAIALALATRDSVLTHRTVSI
jgi:predicted dehydrogenase